MASLHCAKCTSALEWPVYTVLIVLVRWNGQYTRVLSAQVRWNGLYTRVLNVLVRWNGQFTLC